MGPPEPHHDLGRFIFRPATPGRYRHQAGAGLRLQRRQRLLRRLSFQNRGVQRRQQRLHGQRYLFAGRLRGRHHRGLQSGVGPVPRSVLRINGHEFIQLCLGPGAARGRSMQCRQQRVHGRRQMRFRCMRGRRGARLFGPQRPVQSRSLRFRRHFDIHLSGIHQPAGRPLLQRRQQRLHQRRQMPFGPVRRGINPRLHRTGRCLQHGLLPIDRDRHLRLHERPRPEAWISVRLRPERVHDRRQVRVWNLCRGRGRRLFGGRRPVQHRILQFIGHRQFRMP